MTKPSSVKILLHLTILIAFFSLEFFSYGSNLPSDSDNRKGQIKQIETELIKEKKQFQLFDIKEKSLLDQLSEIEKNITEKRIVLRDIRKEIKSSREVLKDGQEKLIKLNDSLMKMEDLLGKRLVSFYKYAKRGYLKMLATASGLDQLHHRLKYLKVILDEDRSIIRKTANERDNYKKDISTIEDQLEAISKLEAEEQIRLSSLKKDLENKVLLLARIHKEKEFYEVAVKELESAARNLKNTLLSIEKGKDKGATLPSGFEQSKGKLPLPLKGKIIKRNIKSGGNYLSSRKGIYIQGEFGSNVNAVFSGRVDFSGQLKGYGQVVVINHGSRFFTISAYLLERRKDKGEMVEKGDLIGYVGETGLLSGPALYFEIRKGETTLDPLKWLKVN